MTISPSSICVIFRFPVDSNLFAFLTCFCTGGETCSLLPRMSNSKTGENADGRSESSVSSTAKQLLPQPKGSEDADLHATTSTVTTSDLPTTSTVDEHVPEPNDGHDNEAQSARMFKVSFEFLQGSIGKHVFWIKDPARVPEQLDRILRYISQAPWKDHTHTAFSHYYNLKLLGLIWHSHKMETGSRMPQNNTRMKLLEIVESPTLPEVAAVSFDMEGDNTHDGWVRLATQAAKAWQYLVEQKKELSEEVLKTCHKIMFEGATNEGKEFIAGEFRTGPVSAGGYDFPGVETIPIRLPKIFKEFHSTGSTNDSIGKATKLFYEILSLHPFANGNGRLSRMLFAYSLHRDGFPFPVQLTNGSRKAKKHYIDALERAQGGRCHAHLYAYAVTAVEIAVNNAEDYFNPGTIWTAQ